MDIIATNITSPLGRTTEENYNAVVNGRTALRQHNAGERGVPFDYCAALFDEKPQFEALAYTSASEALSRAEGIDLSRTVFILSSTKGDLTTPLADNARNIALRLGIKNEPIVVCNACISGVAAQVLALRLLRNRTYDYAVITGADVMTDFIVSGFHSLKALSPEPCRPFDIERLGLNLGEAAATIVAKAHDDGSTTWRVTAGAIANDAYHITNPHPQGEGAYQALIHTLSHSACKAAPNDWLGTISAHGTATMYNDQMESKAIERAGVSDIPVSALKGYYGHTMGAAGLLETILTMRAMDDGVIIATKGFEEIGVSGKVNVATEKLHTDKHGFIKMMSGFGGCNAAITLQQSNSDVAYGAGPHITNTAKNYEIVSEVSLTNKDIPALYKKCIGDYPRFYKMDKLSQLTFIATEILIKDCGIDNINNDLAIILFNRTSSVTADRKYNATISDPENHFPSPSMFVHTLPNIATGEAAIRHGLHGETSFYILAERNEQMMRDIINASMQGNCSQYIITGWIDCPENDDYECDVKLLKKI